MLLDNGRFLTELLRLMQSRQADGTVWVTMKRSNLKPRKSTKKDHSKEPCHCLVRATDGKRKLSTVVTAAELPKFQDSYTTIMKGHMSALKKRDRTRPAKAQ